MSERWYPAWGLTDEHGEDLYERVLVRREAGRRDADHRSAGAVNGRHAGLRRRRQRRADPTRPKIVEMPKIVETLHRVEIKHAIDVRNFHRMQSFHAIAGRRRVLIGTVLSRAPRFPLAHKGTLPNTPATLRDHAVW